MSSALHMAKWLIAATLLFSLTASPGLAQPVSPPRSTAGSTKPIDEVRQGDSFRLGPVYLDPAIRLKELGVDSNVFNQWENEKSDFTFTVTPQADIALPVARAGLVKAAVGADL